MLGTDRRTDLFDESSRYLDRFGLLLLLTLTATAVLSLVDLGREREGISATIAAAVVTASLGAMFVLALRSSGVKRSYRRIADLIVGVILVAGFALIAVRAFGDDPGGAGSFGVLGPLWLLLSIIAPVAVVRRLVHHRRANAQTLLGAVSAYLLIAISFDFIFLTMNSVAGTPFFGGEEPTTSFMYYSMVTITTLGYGDLSAASPLGRFLSTIEGVIGQVYLVTFVAMIVGLFVAQRQMAKTGDRS